MKKEAGCITTLAIMLTITIGIILSWDTGNKNQLKQVIKTEKLIDSIKIDSIIIKVYKQ